MIEISWIYTLGWILFIPLVGITIIGVYTFIREYNWWAVVKASLIFIPLLICFFLVLILSFSLKPLIIFSILSISIILAFVLIYPFNTLSKLQIVDFQTRIDERDAFFHRFFRLVSGSAEFDEYYTQHPDQLEADNKLRALPDLGRPGTITYHPVTTLYQEATFNIIKGITQEIDDSPCPVEDKPIEASAEEFTRRIKGYARYMGAVRVGMTKLNPAYIYSHIGRSPGKWGAPIELNHKYAIAIAVEMSHDMVCHAPDSPAITETAMQYFEAAKIATIIAKFIKLLGYEAQAHVDGNYRVMCVPIAVDAGLGELGRLGLLITPDYGPRIRLAIVTTNIPLIQDTQITFGVQHFCKICKKCAINCPTGSIAENEKNIHAGVEKWQSNQDKCFKYWKKQGTDCGVCVKVCPYSYPKSGMHNLIRWFVRRNNIARQFAFKGDEFFYGRKPKNVLPLPSWHSE